MNRDMSGAFGSESYALEEARVEMAAAFVCNILGLPTDYANHAAYIPHGSRNSRVTNTKSSGVPQMLNGSLIGPWPTTRNTRSPIKPRRPQDQSNPPPPDPMID
jgi:hypothetical protein